MKTGKYLLTLLAALAILLFPATVFAGEPAAITEAETVTETESETETEAGTETAQIESGTCGEALSWVLYEDGTLTISGSGAMSSYSASSAPWYSYRDSILHVSMEEGVTSVGAYAFNGCSSLTEIELPETLTAIWNYAFAGCGMTALHLPDSITSLGMAVFQNCANLAEINYPASLTEVAPGWAVADKRKLFDNCRNLTSITIPEGVTVLPENVFSGCTYLTEIILPSTLTQIKAYAFSGCTSLQDIVLPEGLSVLKPYAFAGCSGLTSIRIPGTLTAIEERVFSGCSSLTDIELPETLTAIWGYAFAGCSMTALHLPDSITTLGIAVFQNCVNLQEINYPVSLTGVAPGWAVADKRKLFDNCRSLTSITIPEGVTVLPENTFSGCNALEEVILPKGLTSISAYSFRDCTALQTIYFAESLGSIGASAFSGCSALSNINFAGSAEQWAAISIGSDNDPLKNKEIHFGVEAPDREKPVAVIAHGDLLLNISDSLEVDGSASSDNVGLMTWSWDFGDGSTDTAMKATHRYAEPGTYTVTLTVMDYNSNTASESITVKIVDVNSEESEYTKLVFDVYDDSTQNKLPNAELILTVFEDVQTLHTDQNGAASVIVPNGWHTISVSASGHFAKSLSVMADGGVQTCKAALSGSGIMTGSITVTEMTYDEILAAGIDPNAEGNQHVFKYASVLTFYAGLENHFEIPYEVYINVPGLVVGRPGPIRYSPEEPDDTEGPSPAAADYGVFPGSPWPSIVIYPISERYVLVIYGEAHWQKEMFRAELIVNNNSSSESLENVTARIQLPDGMSLASMDQSGSPAQSDVIELGSIASEDSGSAQWYLCGDEEGEYNISVDVTATTSGGTELHAVYTTEEPVKVYAGNALHMTITVDDIAVRGAIYTAEFEIKNVSGRTLYDLNFKLTGQEQYKVLSFEYGKYQEILLSSSEFGDRFSRRIREFAPDASVKITVGILIQFDSELESLPFEKVRYYIDNMNLVTLPGSTTEIPYEYVLRHVKDPMNPDPKDVIQEIDTAANEYAFDDLVLSAPSNQYNPELAYYLMGMAKAAYSQSDIKSCLNHLGFDTNSSSDFVISPGYETSDHYADYTLARKAMRDGRTMVMVTVRGTTKNYKEWFTDACCILFADSAGSRLHLGFADSASRLKNKLDAFTKDLSPSETVYVVTGHSMGAATANITAYHLQLDGVPAANIYNYNFACPDVGTTLASQTDNQFNVADVKDLVSMVPGLIADLSDKASNSSTIFPKSWDKYGTSMWFSHDWETSDAIIPDITFKAHSSGSYLNFLCTRPDRTDFKTRNETLGKLDAEGLRRIIVSVLCPVDVLVTDSEGTPVASVIGGEVNYYDSEIGNVIIVTCEDQKVIALPATGTYHVQLTGSDDGSMTYQVCTGNLLSREIEGAKVFENVDLTEGKKMYSFVNAETDTSETRLFVLDEDGTPAAEISEDGTEAKPELALDLSNLSLAVKDSTKLTAQGGGNLVWTSSDEAIASVDQDGTVTAKKYGSAVITVKDALTGRSASCQVQTLFWDVADPGKYYFKHVYWAAETGITKGYNLEYFAPQDECTREQMMTFLWRMAGQPEPKSTVSPFSDVKKGAYYFKAVLWGVEKGITKGYSSGPYAGKFGVGLPCTREQAMTFLWRMAGQPGPKTTVNKFKDIQKSNYYYKAVLWASENGIANGYNSGEYAGKYGVGLPCLREHMVTFLSRYWNKFGM